jgi:hypothetical protein
MTLAQEAKTEVDPIDNVQKTIVEVKEGENPDIYIDGKKYDRHILELLDPERIESVSVIKGEKAKEEYDAEAVILVKTKIKTDLKSPKYNLGANDNKGVYIRSYVGSASPIIIIDGKLENQETLAILNPDSIQSISVLKNEEALKKYGTRSGVILIKTKKASIK